MILVISNITECFRLTIKRCGRVAQSPAGQTKPIRKLFPLAMKQPKLLFAALVLFTASCGQPAQKKETEKIFWTFGLTAPKGYPIETQGGSYLADDKEMISGISNTGIIDDGWSGTGAPTSAGGGDVVPTKLSLTWLSLAEKKFWKLDVNLPAGKITELFKNGYTDEDRQGKLIHADYNYMNLGLAPGGFAVLWMSGHTSTVEVASFKAKEVDEDLSHAAPVAGAYKDIQEFLNERFKDGIKQESREKILKNGIPYGLWESFRQTFNWRLTVQFEKPDTETERITEYLNGEQEMLRGDGLNQYRKLTPPYRVSFYFKQKMAEASFDREEILNAFKTVTKDSANLQVEIIAKVLNQYGGMSFVVKGGGKEIALNKTSILI